MKRQLIALTLSLLASSAFAMPASEQPMLGEVKLSQEAGLPTLAQEGTDRVIHQYQRVAIEENCDNLAHRYQRVADNGPDRLVQQYQRVS
ncbi:hypothetical protein [Pseudomonas sp. SLFW]|uniref:hypothetical protein n=1 Tax=Pseudomonas TaxID=286 RepID=UPI0014122E64|nr:hypothetical protein [Pseudomonas sp. SLFW]NBB10828.1 hypothetical protein [Pseudomonas sp. SLFW]